MSVAETYLTDYNCSVFRQNREALSELRAEHQENTSKVNPPVTMVIFLQTPLQATTIGKQPRRG